MTTVNRHFQGEDRQSAVADFWHESFRRAALFYPGFNTAVIAFAIGIAVYFAWFGEPDWKILTVICAVLGGAYWALRSKAGLGTGLIWLILMMALERALCRRDAFRSRDVGGR